MKIKALNLYIYLLSFILITTGAQSSFYALNAILAIDSPDLEGKTFNSFRTTLDAYREDRLQKLKEGKVKILNPILLKEDKPWEELTEEDKQGILWTTIPTREGLDGLNASGSSQFGAAALETIIKRIRDTGHNNGIVVIDHREEPHAFLNAGVPLSLYAKSDAFNIGKTWAELEEVETTLINSIDQHREVWLNAILQKEENRISMTRLHPMDVNTVYNEKYLVKDMFHCGYIRIGITDHHRAMDDDLDDVKKHFDALPDESWKHFHCRGGKGRTTSGMVLFDILSNHKNPHISFEDIVLRHWLIGGSSLLGVADTDPNKRWKEKAAYDRMKALYRFYQDVHAHKPHTRWFYEQHENFQSSKYIPAELFPPLKEQRQRPL